MSETNRDNIIDLMNENTRLRELLLWLEPWLRDPMPECAAKIKAALKEGT